MKEPSLSIKNGCLNVDIDQKILNDVALHIFDIMMLRYYKLTNYAEIDKNTLKNLVHKVSKILNDFAEDYHQS